MNEEQLGRHTMQCFGCATYHIHVTGQTPQPLPFPSHPPPPCNKRGPGKMQKSCKSPPKRGFYVQLGLQGVLGRFWYRLYPFYMGHASLITYLSHPHLHYTLGFFPEFFFQTQVADCLHWNFKQYKLGYFYYDSILTLASVLVG